MSATVVEWVKHCILRWFGHVVAMNGNGFVKRVHMSSIEGREMTGGALATQRGC